MTFTAFDLRELRLRADRSAGAAVPAVHRRRANDFDIVIVGSGIGGGVLADDLADRLGARKRILVLEAGLVHLPDARLQPLPLPEREPGASTSAATRSGRPATRGARVLHRREAAAQLRRPLDLLVRADPDGAGVGARLLPAAGAAGPGRRPAERGRRDDERVALHGRDRAGDRRAVAAERRSPQDFSIQETPRALHQPYLEADGTPKDRVLHRADRRLQHRRAAREPARPDARASATATDRACSCS